MRAAEALMDVQDIARATGLDEQLQHKPFATRQALIQSRSRETIRSMYASAQVSVTMVGPAAGEPREHMRRFN